MKKIISILLILLLLTACNNKEENNNNDYSNLSGVELLQKALNDNSIKLENLTFFCYKFTNLEDGKTYNESINASFNKKNLTNEIIIKSYIVEDLNSSNDYYEPITNNNNTLNKLYDTYKDKYENCGLSSLNN